MSREIIDIAPSLSTPREEAQISQPNSPEMNNTQPSRRFQPVKQATKIELAINLKSATRIGFF